ncbi:hypothetical protein ACH4C6_33885 [Streptomyces sp. NPDC017943]
MSAVSGPVCGVLVGQQAGDGLDGVAHVLAAAEMAGQARQFVTWAMPCST